MPALLPSCSALSGFAFLLLLPGPAGTQSGQLESPPAKRMGDGKLWTIRNLDVPADASYCYDNSDDNCRRYGRLYTWDAAQHACASLGGNWRLPTNNEWRQLANSYGGLLEDSMEAGKSTYKALRTEGSSGLEIVLGGGRDVDGQYARLGAHGFYWTASETDASHAWLYNFGKGMLVLNRHADLTKERAFSVRCIS